jgi:hypothetical protein
MEESKPELSIETLMQLLKEKAKELKVTQKKLKQLEDKFIEMHKQTKNILSDRDNFIQFLHVVYPPKLLEDEILIMPDGPEGYGLFDVNHLRQFWMLTQQSKENEQLTIVQGLKDLNKKLEEQLRNLEQKDSSRDKSAIDIQEKLNNLLEENDDLKQRLNEFSSDLKLKEVR